MKRREFAARAAVIFVAPTLLSACGFAMKGPSRLPFATVYLDENAQGPVAEMLRRYLQATPMTRLLGTAGQRASAEVQIEIQQDAQDRRAVGANAYGLVRELQLYTRFSFSATAANGDVLIEPTELQQRRDIAFTEAVVLSKEAEEQMLYESMREDIAAQVMRRLEAIRL